jgi:DNA primase
MTWIDFKTLRKGLSFEKVLAYYRVTVKRRSPGNRHQGFCPLPTHQGKKRSPSFSAKLDFGVWQCFGCRASGNVLDFAVRMEGLDPEDKQALRTVALKLQQHFQIPGVDQPRDSIKREGKPAVPLAEPAIKPGRAAIVNPPLDFELKDLDGGHPYLRDRGFSEETIRHFGLGYCNRGLMKGRIAIPLHDAAGRLIGYAGRLADETAACPDAPKYLLPGPRERDGTTYEFRKSLFLYNGHRLPAPAVADLAVVEGFPACWWLWQAGYPAVVALMGSDCSAEQGALIASSVAPDGRVWVFPDAGAAGERCALTVLARVAPQRFCRWVRLDEGQPTDLSPAALSEFFRPV